MSDHAKGFLITFIGVMFLTPDSLMVRLIGASGLTVAFWKAALAGTVIGLFVLVTQGPSAFRQSYARGPLVWLYSACAGGSGALFVIAVSLTSVANVVFIVAAMPIASALFSWVGLGERPSPRVLITIAVVPVGIGLIAFGPSEAGQSSLLGNVIALLTVIVGATGFTLARHLRPTSMVPAVAPGMLAVALLLLPFAEPLSIPPGDWLWVALHGGLFIGVATALLAVGPRYITAPEVALLILLESVLAPILAWLFVGEIPAQCTLVGGAIVICALALSNLVALLRR